MENFALQRLYEEELVTNRSQTFFGDSLCLTLTIKIEMSSSRLLYKEGRLAAFSRSSTQADRLPIKITLTPLS